jgi:hypothetical protein
MLWECQTLWNESQRRVAIGVDAGASASSERVRVRCQAGVRTVHITLPITWEDTLSDQELLAAIAQELGREG